MPKILALLQARVSSNRLPGKVMLPLLGKPMLFRQIERVQNSKLIDQLVVATSTEPSDDSLAKACSEHLIPLFRGSLTDVLDRFYQAALLYTPEHVVRLTGDCPLADPAIIDQVIQFHLEGGYDYSSNALDPTFPDGLDVEVIKFSLLKDIWKNATLKSDREHVTPFAYKNTKNKIGILRSQENLSHLRLTVDEPKDFLLVTKIFESLYPKNKNFNLQDILTFLKSNPDLQKINSTIQRNEGYKNE